MRTRKIVGWGIVGVVVLLVVAVLAVFLLVDRLAKQGIERGGTYALGVPTQVDSVSVSLLGGSLGLDTLNVANPQGYGSPYLMRTGTFDMAVEPGSLLSDTVVVPQFELKGLDVHIEAKGLSSNVGEILDHIKKLGQTTEQPTQEAGGGKKVRLDRVVIRDVTAHVHLPLAASEPVVVRVPAIELEGVSSDQAGGATVAALVAQLVPAIIQAVLEAGEGVIPADLLAGLEGQVNQAMTALGGEAAELVRQAGADVARQVEAYAPEAGQAVQRATETAQEAVDKAADRAQGAVEGALERASRALKRSDEQQGDPER